MGYFSNGSSGGAYQEQFCDRCHHDRNQSCPIWLLHLVHNYEECNKEESFLNVLIPRDKEGGNEQCVRNAWSIAWYLSG